MGGVRVLVFGLVAGSAALSSPTAAQETRRLDLGLSAAVERHSNVARSNRTVAALRGIKTEDTIFTPSASVDLTLPVGRQAFYLQGNVGYSFYQENRELNRERLNLAGGVRGRFGPCQTNLFGGYAKGVSEIEDPLFDADVRNIRETERIGLDVSCTRSVGLGVSGSVSQEWGSNDLALYKMNDYERTSYQIGITYSRPTLGTLTVFAGRQSTDYPNRFGPVSGYDVDNIGLSYRRQLGARIQGMASVGYAHVEQKGALSGDYDTTSYAGSLTYRASNRLRFGADFDRSINPSSAIGGGYDLSTSYRLSGEYDFGSRLTLGVAGGRVERNAHGGIVVPGALRDSTVDSIEGSARFKQSERLSFVLTAGRYERAANVPQFEYADNYVGLAADLRF